jgi:hypothetical protein
MDSRGDALAVRHFRTGWWAIFLFMAMGVLLESLHGFKVGMYLSPANSVRRMLWTLAHAHGTLLGLVNLAMAMAIRWLPEWPARGRAMASGCVTAATVLVPAGFFLGGLNPYGGDPGWGIFLVPPGAALGVLGVGLVALASRRCRCG